MGDREEEIKRDGVQETSQLLHGADLVEKYLISR